MHTVGVCSNCGRLNACPLLLTDNNGNVSTRRIKIDPVRITAPSYPNECGHPQNQACRSHCSWTPRLLSGFHIATINQHRLEFPTPLTLVPRSAPDGQLSQFPDGFGCHHVW